MEKWGYFQQHEKYRYHIAIGFLYLGNIVLGVLKEDLGGFSTPKEALKMVLGYVLLGCSHNFSLDLYYEPR